MINTYRFGAVIACAMLAALAVGNGGSWIASADEVAPQVTIELNAYKKTFNILGVPIEAWTYDGTVPGTIIRVEQGTHLTIRLRNAHSEAHSIHTHISSFALTSDGTSRTAPLPIVPHQNDDTVSAASSGYHGPALGMNPIGPYDPRMDDDVADPGEVVDYNFITSETGTFLFHCHVFPAAEHIQRGLFGMIIVYPKGWSWNELPKDPTFGNTKAWVTDANGKVWFEDVVMINELDPAAVQEKLSVPTTGDAGKFHLANFRAWNDPYVVGPVASGTPIRLVVADIGDSVHSWHIHSHAFDILDKYNPEKPVLRRTDTMLIGPGESYETTLIAGPPGYWLMHDHIVPDAYAGMVPWLHILD